MYSLSFTKAINADKNFQRCPNPKCTGVFYNEDMKVGKLECQSLSFRNGKNRDEMRFEEMVVKESWMRCPGCTIVTAKNDGRIGVLYAAKSWVRDGLIATTRADFQSATRNFMDDDVWEFFLSVFNGLSLLDHFENKHLLQPPVNNFIIFRGDFIVMALGGPNRRTDYHVNATEEYFYQYKGDMLLKIVEDGEFKDVPIKEGEMLVLPANVPHNPVRFAETVGIVIEMKRPADKLGWYF
ncbi:3-hydroxyanthranilic acid dioxygenase [Physocladia obscura]|uniref:3-hydroxyanthranilic acid dioxygenase n=1 Tax=Physocladia obscura TaxID=109957 RepID=A0AAD5SQ85_9FUNG|nr:3-hydroxyanthranilic acid dioxygenase [Physocladia obscura]